MTDSGSNNIPTAGNIFMGSMEVNPNSTHMEKWQHIINQKLLPSDFTMPYRHDINNDRFLLNAINDFVNTWPYIHDFEYGVPDIWKTPIHMMRDQGGDCEDSGIFKFALAEQAGFSNSDLRLVLVRRIDAARLAPSHAICAVRIGNDWYVMDNQTAVPMQPESMYTGVYEPMISMNRVTTWRFLKFRSA